jgi:hypothetical protein
MPASKSERSRFRPAQSGTIMMALALTALACSAGPVKADDTNDILKSMTSYVASEKNISLSFDSAVEVLTPQLEKIQFASSGTMVLSRPDKLHATRTGGYADVELVYDGKTATLYGRNLNAYAQADAPASIDELIELLRAKLGADMPGADLVLAGAYDALTEGVIEGKHIGRGVVDGLECEHLAFRDADTDWQLWVEVGPKPIPRKYVITSKAVAGAPQYTLVIRSWKTDEQPGADAFAFKPKPDAKKVDFAALADLDEVPPGMPQGAMK